MFFIDFMVLVAPPWRFAVPLAMAFFASMHNCLFPGVGEIEHPSGEYVHRSKDGYQRPDFS